ncbi:uncharacterized protein Z520_05848 [Fonsecaea multimorphosa CBS 102226]|uniref:F-box domain-containing protein n=1 Tax=Fonsecaea multimorphosa CBS 102226 TaxID=1442371 RepID=A0A0D2JYD1_9EURO|nr:uncharacterized protein Z520_05848 [Fonsecaea multimorphosa CBS 102226]KIX98547.1 hypothetical protein Z520_05848 [Fonsecaea multimorphosa CBS 102226]OAL24739.1 hypothetical protein AYO22_05528 [Fonsecaea multimorphosa]
MDDKPPPKKKSRFFSNGKSKVGNILHPFKKQSQAAQEISPDNSTDDSPQSATNNPLLLPNIHTPVGLQTTNPTLTQAGVANSGFGLSRSIHQTSKPPSHGSAARTDPAANVQHQGDRQGKLPQPDATESEVETDLETSSGSEDDQQEQDESDQENVKPNTNPQSNQAVSGLDQMSSKHKRRNAIYGVENLLPPGSPRSNTNGQHAAQGSTPISAPAPPGPLGNSYTFGGVPTNPYVIPAGGQYPFNFRTAQVAPMPSTVERATSDSLRHPLGSGLARIAQQTVHPDTGPLRQQQRPVPTKPSNNGTPAYVDLDRDEYGRRLRNFPSRMARPIAHHGIYVRPTIHPHLGLNPESLVPENFHTAPNRIEHAQEFARLSRKRKRPEAILPPQSYVYQHTGDPNFNIFHGFLLYPELCFTLAAHLPVKDLVSLYAISRDFHTILDTRFTTVILSQATAKAPESARCFMFRSYAHLCRSDPAARIPHPNALLALHKVPRRIPSFRWLKMILHREKVIHEIMTVFAEDGIPLPARCALALKRLWFMLDIPDNARRIGYCHNRGMMTDLDLYFSACFFMKLDMRLNDPVSWEKRDGMRKLLLAQRSFFTILRVLKRDIWTTRFDALREWVKCKYTPAPDEVGLSIFGVPPHRIGKGRLEYWGLKGAQALGRQPEVLLRPDQLIIREAFRRGIRFEKHYLRFMLYGYIRPDTLEDYAPRTYGRRIGEIKDDEYEVDDVVGGVAALGVDDEGFDPLLDLGQPRQVSRLTIVKEETSKREMELRKAEEELLKKCHEWWEHEQKQLRESQKQKHGGGGRG